MIVSTFKDLLHAVLLSSIYVSESKAMAAGINRKKIAQYFQLKKNSILNKICDKY